jgi:hypothetical protein
MGREVRCLVRHGGQEAEAKALLETDEIIVRSPFRITVPRRDITSAVAADGRLTIEYEGGPLLLELGDREAAKWAHDIAHPKTLADKLGVKDGQRVALVNGAAADLAGRGAVVADGEEADVAFVAVDEPGDLDQIGAQIPRLARDGAVWAIRPKGRDDLTEAMVMSAGLDAGLVAVKTARVSASLTGEKFVIPRDAR